MFQYIFPYLTLPKNGFPFSRAIYWIECVNVYEDFAGAALYIQVPNIVL